MAAKLMADGNTPNIHGLKRSDFREPSKRELRQACGFGCVICGNALYEYAHIDPRFEDARQHDISRMALLCPNHHDEYDKWKRLSSAEVMEARANPRAKRDGFVRDHLQCRTNEFLVAIGNTEFFGCSRILDIEGVDIPRIDRPEIPDGPYQINGVFCDSKGSLIGSIVRNEICYRSQTWDIQIEGCKITFRTGHRQICLALTTIPDKGFRIERIDMMWAGSHVLASDESGLVINGTATGTAIHHSLFQDCESCICVCDGRVYVGGQQLFGAELVGCLVTGRS